MNTFTLRARYLIEVIEDEQGIAGLEDYVIDVANEMLTLRAQLTIAEAFIKRVADHDAIATLALIKKTKGRP
jgi:hypothetical protein